MINLDNIFQSCSLQVLFNGKEVYCLDLTTGETMPMGLVGDDLESPGGDWVVKPECKLQEVDTDDRPFDRLADYLPTSRPVDKAYRISGSDCILVTVRPQGQEEE